MLLNDSFVNLVSGLGTHKDKTSHGRFTFNYTLSKYDIDAAYRSNWLVGKMIDAPADDMTREWRTWSAGERQLRAINAAERQFSLPATINRALKCARLYGGSAILIGDGAADPTKPLDVQNFQKGSLQYLHVLSRWEIWAAGLIRDPTNPYFGQPEYFELANVQGSGVQIHPSRVIRFQGIPWLELSYTWDGWGFSILERFYEEARNVTAAAGNLASMTYEAKLDVIKIPGLTQNVVDETYRTKLMARLSLANMTKSVQNAILLDATEEWDQKTINLSNMPEGIRTLLEIASGAADMPVTRLLGTSPKGLNATGQSEIRNYYDMLAGRQTVEIEPAIAPLDQVLVRHALGTFPDDVHYEWNPLWQVTEAEQAAMDMQRAQTNQIYATMSLTGPSAMRELIVAKLIKDKTFPGVADTIAKYASEEPEALGHKEEITKLEIDTPSTTAHTAKTDSAPTPRKAKVKVDDAEPRSMYVSRGVVNATEILRWAKNQKIPNLMKASDLHVTIAFSKDPVDWFRAYTDSDRLVIPPGGPRLFEPIGDKGAMALLFSSDSLSWRWQHFIDMGASWDWEGYQPHISITWNAQGFDYTKVTPYTGKIVLGPERFAEVDENWADKLKK